eukprot:GFUD01140168.1.p1 GENE.GFUD01140168.1~~GFUD01140168.1.p1  ORF type:complete len:182 (+),score=79.57 GFUD01140168.1:39-584(+)
MKKAGGKKGGGNGGSKGGAKRHVSKIKRSNQRQNKLVKTGKAKPNSKPRYIPNAKKAVKGEKGEKEAWLTPELRDKWAKDQEEDADAALDQLAEEIAGKSAAGGKKRVREDDGESDNEESDEEGLGELERGAMARMQLESSRETKVRGLLPIKTKEGVKQRIEEVEELDHESSEEEEEEEE